MLLEEYLQQESDLVKTVKEPIIFTWIVAPTVIYGRHQVREQEVNDAYCAEHGIWFPIFRLRRIVRKSLTSSYIFSPKPSGR